MDLEKTKGLSRQMGSKATKAITLVDPGETEVVKHL